METQEFEGVVYTYKEHHGAWFADPEREAVDTFYAPAFRDGTMDTENISQIDVSHYVAAGEPCEARCDLCLAEQERDVYTR